MREHLKHHFSSQPSLPFREQTGQRADDKLVCPSDLS
jgi:hypothetical protein